MKTARFWQSQSPRTVYDQDAENWIQQIQLDAIKEGLLQAAKIAENTCGKGYKFSEFNRGALSVKQNILAQTHHENR